MVNCGKCPTADHDNMKMKYVAIISPIYMEINYYKYIITAKSMTDLSQG